MLETSSAAGGRGVGSHSVEGRLGWTMSVEGV